MVTRPLHLDPEPFAFQVYLLVEVDDEDSAPSADVFRTLGQQLAKMLDLAAELVVALGPLGWRPSVRAESGHLAARLEKTGPAAAIYAELRALPGRLYEELLSYVPIVATRDSEVFELCLTEDGFAPFPAALPAE